MLPLGLGRQGVAEIERQRPGGVFGGGEFFTEPEQLGPGLERDGKVPESLLVRRGGPPEQTPLGLRDWSL